MTYLLLYIDDMILTGSTPQLLNHIISLFGVEFSMSDLVGLHYFLGTLRHGQPRDYFYLNRDMLLRFLSMCPRPIVNLLLLLLSLMDLVLLLYPTLYHSLAGALQYLTFTRPDITYVVQHICLYTHDPCELHFTALKHISRYV